MGCYLGSMSGGTLILWCYFIWYLVMTSFYLEGDFALWINSLGLSLVVGTALVLATGPVSTSRIREQFWQVVRLFMCPFCVSSFSALTKNKGFILLISPQAYENTVAIALCLCFWVLVVTIRKFQFPTEISCERRV